MVEVCRRPATGRDEPQILLRVGVHATAASPKLLRTAHRNENFTSSGEEQLDSLTEPTGTLPDRDSSTEARSRLLIPAAELSAKPTAEEFRGALLHYIDDAGAELESRQSLDTSASVLVVDDLAVEKLRLKKDQGSIEIRLDCSVAVFNGQVSENPVTHKRNLNLLRSSAGWLVEDKEAPLYVPRQIALRLCADADPLARRPAGLTDGAGGDPAQTPGRLEDPGGRAGAAAGGTGVLRRPADR